MPPLTREFDASEPLRVNVFPTRRGRRVTSQSFRVANVTINDNPDALMYTIAEDGQSVEFTAGDAAEDGQVITGVIEGEEEGTDPATLRAEFEFTVVNVNPDGVELEAEPGNSDGVELEPGTGDAGGDAGAGGEPPTADGDAGTDAAGGDVGGDAGPAPAPAPAPGAPPGPTQVAPGFRPPGPPPPPPPPPAPPAAPRGGGGRGRGGNR